MKAATIKPEKWFKGKTVECNRCDKVWRLRKAERPSQCPGCHDSRWDRDRVLARRS